MFKPTLGKKFKEHTDCNHPSCGIQEHINLTGHPVTLDLVKMCKEDTKTRSKVKEAIEIYKDGPALNRDHNHEIPSPNCPPFFTSSSHIPGHME